MTKKLSTKSLTLWGALVFGLTLSSGCYLEVTDNGQPIDTYLADLQVNWTIDGVDAASLCGTYGISRWRVTVSGPDSRSVILDCRSQNWSTESDLFGLAEGHYSIAVTAEDLSLRSLATVSTTFDLMDQGRVESVQIAFYGNDFH
jgi:hypothetical protein